jgi:hypothetical protein
MSTLAEETPDRAAARQAREAQAALAAQSTRALAAQAAQPRPIPPPAIPDPLPFCVYATVALLAWILTPAAVLAFFAARGFLAYRRAWCAGLRQSECILRDPRLVMLYLGILATAGATWTVWSLWMVWRRFV